MPLRPYLGSKASIICFFGPDGSGKSTLAKALARRLHNENLKVKLSWMRGSHTLASLLAKFLSRFSCFRGHDNPYYGISLPQRFRKFWQLIELVSVFPVVLFRFIIPSITKTVIAERYLPDFIVWVAVTTKDEGFLKSTWAKFLLAITSKAQIRIYVTADIRELVRRRNISNEDFLLTQIKPYDIIAQAIGAHKLDTTNMSVEESLQRISVIVHDASR